MGKKRLPCSRRSCYQGKNAHPLTALIGNDQGTLIQLIAVAPEKIEHQRTDHLRQHVQAAHLQNTGAIGTREGKHGPEVEIVGKDRIAMGQGPGHQVAIRSAWIAHLGPMHRLVTGCLKERDPLSRQVHIDQKPRHQVSTSASSRSSRRQAA
jgi:hypothetical protein